MSVSCRSPKNRVTAKRRVNAYVCVRGREPGGEQLSHRRRNRLVSPRLDLNGAGGPRGTRCARQALRAVRHPNAWSLSLYGAGRTHARLPLIPTRFGLTERQVASLHVVHGCRPPTSGAWIYQRFTQCTPRVSSDLLCKSFTEPVEPFEMQSCIRRNVADRVTLRPGDSQIARGQQIYLSLI